MDSYKLPSRKAIASGRLGQLVIKRGLRYRVLTDKLLLFWTGRRLWEVVAHRGSNVFKGFSVDFISRKTEHQ